MKYFEAVGLVQDGMYFLHVHTKDGIIGHGLYKDEESEEEAIWYYGYCDVASIGVKNGKLDIHLKDNALGNGTWAVIGRLKSDRRDFIVSVCDCEHCANIREAEAMKSFTCSQLHGIEFRTEEVFTI